MWADAATGGTSSVESDGTASDITEESDEAELSSRIVGDDVAGGGSLIAA